MSISKLKVALVGCGQIADAHLQEIRKIPRASVVAVCDRHMDLAAQAAARFGVPATFDDFAAMLRDARPDVVHITTPPQTHRSMAIQALRAGVHVYVEKPFTADVAEADDIIEAASANRRLICVGHDQLFDPLWLECRKKISAGELGAVVHVESIQGYDLSGPFGKLFAAEPDHWVHRLPGGLFQNVMSHAMYRITDLLPDAEPEIHASAFAPISTAQTPTELRAMLRGKDVTASLVFSSTMRPVQRLTRVWGTKCAIELDFEGGTLRTYRKLTAPGAFAKIQAPARQFKESARALFRSLYRFARCDIHYFAGMRGLFTAFYDAILDGGEPPISTAEIRRVTYLMDQIFQQCGAGSGTDQMSPRDSRLVSALA